MFGTAAFDRMPDTFLTDPAVWDAFIGQVWHNVLSPLALTADATIIEIAPGSSAKIGYALAAFGFAGNLHIVEASVPALDIVADHYRRLIPKATLHLHAAPLSECLPKLPRAADALIGNHIIDDMLLNASTAEANTFNWATQYSNAISPETRSAFAQLEQHHTQAVAHVSGEIANTIATLAPRHIVLSQYPSSTLQDNGLGTLNDCASAVLEQLKMQLPDDHAINDCTAALATLPHYHNAHIGHNVLNPRHWLSCTRKI